MTVVTGTTVTTTPFVKVSDVLAEDENSRMKPEGIDPVAITKLFAGSWVAEAVPSPAPIAKAGETPLTNNTVEPVKHLI